MYRYQFPIPMTLPLRLLYRVGRALLLLFLLLFLGACASVSLPASPAGNVGPAATARDERIGPRPPVAYPDSMGGIIDLPVVDGMEDAMADALACLAGGQPVFAVMQYNANVRNEPNSQGCRLGRAPAGTVVRVEAIFGQGEITPFASLDRSLSLLPLSTPGYDEDIQPIFEESCSVCHSDTLQLADLHVTAYEPLLAGGQSGPVVVPGDPDASQLWLQIRSGAMPLVGELSDDEKSLVYEWILAGAARQGRRTSAELWLRLSNGDFSWSPNDCAEDGGTIPYINAQLAVAASCAAIPTAEQVAASLLDVQPLAGLSSPTGLSSATTLPSPTTLPSSGQSDGDESDGEESDSDESDGAAALPILDNIQREITAGNLPKDIVGIEVAPLGLGVPSDADPWLIPHGGFCIEQYLVQVLQDRHSITSLAFAPDGRLFVALDVPATGDYDPNLLYDPFYPVRTVAVWDGDSYQELLRESSRITGMAWHEGALYLNRAAEVGRIPDGGTYEYLAGGFAVAGRLFHANNGLVVRDGWLYVAAGGVRDGYSDGTIVPADGDLPAETLATFVAAGGNRFSARIVRARLEQLLAERTLAVFQTVARGVRNPYGIATDPWGRVWFTDNGATNVPGTFGAGDEVNLLDPRRLSAAYSRYDVAGDENDTPFYGFPMTLGGAHKEWWSEPVLPLPNSAAPTGITWAYDTIFFAQYGRDPGLYRIANAGGDIIAERVLLGWPIQAVTTAPDGAVWIGTGTGGLFRLRPDCAG